VIIVENFLSKNLYNSLEKQFSSIDLSALNDIFDHSYEKKSNKEEECIPLRIHSNSQISYKEFFISTSVLDEFRSEIIKKFFDDYKFNKIIFQFSIWNPGSLLNMHFDNIYKYGGTLYFNNWDESWGGLFKFRDEKTNINFVCPQKNLFVFNNRNELHGVTEINLNVSEKRKTVQVWMLD